MTRRTRTEVLFAPDWRGANPYLERLSSGLERAGFRVSFDQFPGGFFKLTQLANRHPSIGIIHIHWIQPFIGDFLWSRSRVKFNIRLVLLALDILLCKARGMRIVWTLHNLVEHDSHAPDRELRVRALLARLADALIAHSEEALEALEASYALELTKKGHVIPHGNYIGMYKHSSDKRELLRKRYALEDGDIKILFFGTTRQYKGLDLLLSTFREVTNQKYRLLIAGAPWGDETKQWLIRQARGDARIRLSLGLVPDEQVAAHFALADAVVLPFQKILTSGSAILAMGFGKCLILPERARVLGVPGKAGALYYEDALGLKDLLTKLPEFDLKGMGEHNLKVARGLDWRKIAASTAKVYLGNEGRIVWRPQGHSRDDERRYAHGGGVW